MENNVDCMGHIRVRARSILGWFFHHIYRNTDAVDTTPQADLPFLQSAKRVPAQCEAESSQKPNWQLDRYLNPSEDRQQSNPPLHLRQE